MKRYSLGFLIDDQRSPKVWLIKKNRPEWQKGLYNGIGGHIEPTDLNPYQAMVREFAEEGGLEIKHWDHFCTLTDGENFEMFCYRAFSVLVPTAMTDEPIESQYIDSLVNVVPNLYWMVPMAYTFDSNRMEPYKIKEKMI